MRQSTIVLAASVVIASVLGPAFSAPPAAAKPVKLSESKGQVILSWEQFVKITGFDPAKKKGVQVITVKWSEIEDLIGGKIKGVVAKGTTIDLPWSDFKALLEWSVKQKAPAEELAPPADFIVTASEYAGQLSSEDGAAFVLKLKLNVLREAGWKRIPLLPVSVALTKATLPDGVFVNAGSKAYELLTVKSGAIDVTLEFSVATTVSAGINQVTFRRLLPGSSVVDLTIGRKDVAVKVAGAQSTLTKTVQETTRVAAAIPTGVPVSISWERALPEVKKAPPKLYAETRTLVSVAEGLLLCKETVNFNILHSPVRQLALQVPKGISVLAVTGANLLDWRVSDKGELQVLLRQEVIGSYRLSVTYEQPAAASVEVPVIRALGVERERGFVGVVALANVEISPGKVVGATGIDVRQLPADIVSMTNQPILLAFRYVGAKLAVPLTIKKHEEVAVLVTIVDRVLFTTMQLADGRRMTRAVYSVRNNRNQFLRLQMPEGPDVDSAEIWSVSVGGKTVSPAKDAQGNVLIPLIRSAGSARELAGFPVELVYVETPKTAPQAKGTLHVDLPTLDAPVMHVMVDYYLPAEGKYTVSVGLFGKKSGFSGPLRLVDRFTSLSTGAGVAVTRLRPAAQAKEMQKQFDKRVAAIAKAAGVVPIRVRLPINGKLFKLEKILALPKDKLWFEVAYSGWEVEQK